jgi:hypothetical protein
MPGILEIVDKNLAVRANTGIPGMRANGRVDILSNCMTNASGLPVGPVGVSGQVSSDGFELHADLSLWGQVS